MSWDPVLSLMEKVLILSNRFFCTSIGNQIPQKCLKYEVLTWLLYWNTEVNCQHMMIVVFSKVMGVRDGYCRIFCARGSGDWTNKKRLKGQPCMQDRKKVNLVDSMPLVFNIAVGWLYHNLINLMKLEPNWKCCRLFYKYSHSCRRLFLHQDSALS